MPRVPRSALPEAGYFHVTARGAGRIAIVRDDDDRRRFLQLLASAGKRVGWQVYAYCLMDTHYHVVVEAERDALSRALHRVNGVYAQGFNRRHGRWGHLFGERFAAWVVLDEGHLIAACRYVLRNPVRAGLCERAAEWPWSGSSFRGAKRHE